MKIDKISAALDSIHVRLPRAARMTFRAAAALLVIGTIHIFAASLIDAYSIRVLEQFARAEAERSMLALPLAHILGVSGVFAFLLWLPMILLRILLGLRARLWRRVIQ